jgi:hypothetical protein
MREWYKESLEVCGNGDYERDNNSDSCWSWKSAEVAKNVAEKGYEKWARSIIGHFLDDG